jgi:hypothetical protein
MARVVCFGYVNPGEVFFVERYPAANTGAYVRAKHAFIGADCAMVAQMLAGWGVEAHLIGNALGADELGHRTLRALNERGVHTHIVLRRDLHTPHEVDISDRAGTRTFFVEDAPQVWGSLADADLTPIRGAAMLYVDWYVGPPVERAVDLARAHGVPVFINVEYSLKRPELHRNLIAKSTYAQSPMSDVHVGQEDPYALIAACAAWVRASLSSRAASMAPWPPMTKDWSPCLRHQLTSWIPRAPGRCIPLRRFMGCWPAGQQQRWRASPQPLLR